MAQTPPCCQTCSAMDEPSRKRLNNHYLGKILVQNGSPSVVLKSMIFSILLSSADLLDKVAGRPKPQYCQLKDQRQRERMHQFWHTTLHSDVRSCCLYSLKSSRLCSIELVGASRKKICFGRTPVGGRLAMITEWRALQVHRMAKR